MAQWYYARNKQRYGPVSLAELRALVDSGQIQPNDMVLQDGSEKWVAAESVPGLFAAASSPLVSEVRAASPVKSVGEEFPVVELARRPCPFCGRAVLYDSDECGHCGRSLRRPPSRRRRRPSGEREQFEATDMLIPTNVSGWAMAGCYLGLVGLCIPFVGLVFALPGLICSIVALSKPAQGGTYGAVTSNIRAWIGLVLGGLGTLLWAALTIWLLLQRR